VIFETVHWRISENAVKATFAELLKGEDPRILLLGTTVNKERG
jgi:hypothetical protein